MCGKGGDPLQVNSNAMLTYRSGLFYLRTRYEEADLLIASESNSTINKGLADFIKEMEAVRAYAAEHPDFVYSLEPIEIGCDAPPAVKLAAEASGKAGVGPMAALPGALADLVLDSMLSNGARTTIVENGGEVSMTMNRETIVGIYTGRELNIGLIIDNSEKKVGISTSSGRVSHALSLGDADAAVVVAESAALADAVSTRVGNIVKSGCRDSFKEAIELALSIHGVKGCIIYSNALLGFGGQIKPIMLNAKDQEIFELMLLGPKYSFKTLNL